jgi:hypothetical protein
MVDPYPAGHDQRFCTLTALAEFFFNEQRIDAFF